MKAVLEYEDNHSNINEYKYIDKEDSLIYKAKLFNKIRK
jgi:hypothetical protein